MNSAPDCEQKALRIQLWLVRHLQDSCNLLTIYKEFLAKDKLEIKPNKCITIFKQVWTCQNISKLVQIVIIQ